MQPAWRWTHASKERWRHERARDGFDTRHPGDEPRHNINHNARRPIISPASIALGQLGAYKID